MIISLLVVVTVATGVVREYGAHWYDGTYLVVSLVLVYMVARLTKNGERLKEQIKEACTPEVKRISRAALVKPTPTTGV